MAARRATSNTSDLTHTTTDNRPTINHHHHPLPVSSLEDCKKKKGLPNDFASMIMQLEICMEENTIEIFQIKDLLEMYMIGVEYYESIGDQRYIYFQKKMSNLITQQNVIATIEKQHALDHPAESKYISPYLDTLQQKPQGQETKTTDRNEEIDKQSAKKKNDFFQEMCIFKHESDNLARKQVLSMQDVMKHKSNVVSSILKAQRMEILHRLSQRKNRLTPILDAEKNNQSQENQIISQLGANTMDSSLTNSSSSNSSNSVNNQQPHLEETGGQILNMPNFIGNKDSSFSQPSLSFNESLVLSPTETSISLIEENNNDNNLLTRMTNKAESSNMNINQQLNRMREKGGKEGREEKQQLFQQNSIMRDNESNNGFLRNEEQRHQ